MPAGTSTKKTPKQPQDRKASQKPAWGQKAIFDLTLPSGYEIQVRRPGVFGLVKAGIIDGLDSLTSIVQGETIPKADGAPQVDAMKLAKDPEKMGQLMDMLDKITKYVVVEPKLFDKPVPLDYDGVAIVDPTDDQIDALREDGVAYVDLVDDNDKTFVMNFVLGGSKDLETFHAATEAAVGSAHPEQAAEEASE